jgi:hypothetical protein
MGQKKWESNGNHMVNKGFYLVYCIMKKLTPCLFRCVECGVFSVSDQKFCPNAQRRSATGRLDAECL